jgi:uncharacterized protein YidB (DUF937 family)
VSKSTPSVLALLGLVAIAGYQNRGRIGEMLADARQNSTDGSGFLAEIGQAFQASPLSTTLSDLVQRFKAVGQGHAADSWVSDRANMPLGTDALQAALGAETLADLAHKTGMSQGELLLRLNVALPEVVNRLTPDGRLPNDSEGSALI